MSTEPFIVPSEARGSILVQVAPGADGIIGGRRDFGSFLLGTPDPSFSMGTSSGPAMHVPAGYIEGMHFEGQGPMTTTTTTTVVAMVDAGGPSHPPPDAPTGTSPAYADTLSLLTQPFEKIFSFFARVDTDNNGGIDAKELTKALGSSAVFRQQVCSSAGIADAGGDDEASLAALAARILEVADTSGDGQVQAAELERLLRGWQQAHFDTREDMTSANEERRLKGAAEIAERTRVEHGGFKGLSAEEALNAGEGVQLGGTVVEDETVAHPPKRRMPKGLAAKLQKKSASTPTAE